MRVDALQHIDEIVVGVDLFAVVDGSASVNGYDIERYRDETRLINGVGVTLDRIVVTSNLFVDTFWFSSDRGLLMLEFELREEGSRGSFVLRGECGYGASETCAE
jgi:hypothetical protein